MSSARSATLRPQPKPTTGAAKSSESDLHKGRTMACWLAASAIEKFISAMQKDYYPEKAVEAMFGVQMEGQHRPMGNLVFNVWMALNRAGLVDRDVIVHTMLDGELPAWFEATVRGLPPAARDNCYIKRLLEAGFKGIPWDVQMHARISQCNQGTLKGKLPENMPGVLAG